MTNDFGPDLSAAEARKLHRVAGIMIPASEAFGGRCAIAEEALESYSRIDLHRQRLRGRCPADGVGVDATVAVAAGA